MYDCSRKEGIFIVILEYGYMCVDKVNLPSGRPGQNSQ